MHCHRNSSAVFGGLGSVAGGGKFANGAITGAFGYMYNNAAGALMGMRIGSVGAGLVFSETGPFVGLFVAAGAVGGAMFGDWLTGPDILRSDNASSAPEIPESVGPGPYAGTPIPAGPSPTPTAEQQGAINAAGDAGGCHTCGTTDPGTISGNWVGDHQPTTALNPPGNPQVYYPQCLPCSNAQGGLVRGIQRGQ